MKKLKFLLIIFALTPLFSIAQKNIGYDLFLIGDYELAKKYYQQHVTANPVEANYYLGEIAFAEGKFEEAKALYTKGLNADANDPFNAIGLAKLENKDDRKNAEKALEAIQEKFYKNIEATIAIGYAYLSIKQSELALKKVDAAVKLDKTQKDPRPYLLHGDILATTNNYGAATGKYETAIYFDPHFAIPYIKVALVYENSSTDKAIAKLQEIAKKQPDYLLTYRYLGKYYTDEKDYGEATEAYKKFFTLNTYSFADLSQYITALYFNRQYEEAKIRLKEALAIEPTNFVSNRLLMYCDALLQSEEGVASAKKFFATPKNANSTYLASDYSMYGAILKKAKMYDEAMMQYKKAIELDSSNAELFKEYASLLGDKKEYSSAVRYFSLYLNKVGAYTKNSDYQQAGLYNYDAGCVTTASDSARLLNLQKDTEFTNKISTNDLQRDSLTKNKSLFIKTASNYYLSNAALYFDTVIQRYPEGQIGYLWKARATSLLDPTAEAGLAKPYYEKVAEIITAKNETNETLLEAYRYLAYYYFVKEEKENIILYWSKVLELDPKNEHAIKVLKSYKR